MIVPRAMVVKGSGFPWRGATKERRESIPQDKLLAEMLSLYLKNV